MLLAPFQKPLAIHNKGIYARIGEPGAAAVNEYPIPAVDRRSHGIAVGLEDCELGKWGVRGSAQKVHADQIVVNRLLLRIDPGARRAGPHGKPNAVDG